MTKAELIAQIKDKESFLCVGLDPDLTKIPQHLLQTEDPLYEFCKAIIDATHAFAVAFKPNTAFLNAMVPLVGNHCAKQSHISRRIV